MARLASMRGLFCRNWSPEDVVTEVAQPPQQPNRCAELTNEGPPDQDQPAHHRHRPRPSPPALPPNHHSRCAPHVVTSR